MTRFREKFYKITAWLGTYFPVRFVVTTALRLRSKPYDVLVQEVLVLTAYLTAATLLTLAIDKGELRRKGMDG